MSVQAHQQTEPFSAFCLQVFCHAQPPQQVDSLAPMGMPAAYHLTNAPPPELSRRQQFC